MDEYVFDFTKSLSESVVHIDRASNDYIMLTVCNDEKSVSIKMHWSTYDKLVDVQKFGNSYLHPYGIAARLRWIADQVQSMHNTSAS